MNRNNDLWDACCHEAGHAVAAALFGLRVLRVWVEKGRKQQPYDGQAEVDQSANVRKNVFVTMSGIAADVVFGMDERTALNRIDVTKARGLVADASGLPLSAPAVLSEVRFWYDLVKQRLGRHDAHQAVAALAQALYDAPEVNGRREILGQDAECIIQKHLLPDTAFLAHFP